MTDLVGLGQRKPCHHQAENGATAEKEDATPHFSQPLGFYKAQGKGRRNPSDFSVGIFF
jgi:hypothetical protein